MADWENDWPLDWPMQATAHGGQRRERPVENPLDPFDLVVTPRERSVATSSNSENARHGNGRVVYSSNWCFTLWRHEPPQLVEGIRYICAQPERATNPSEDNATGGFHWQGYLETDSRISLIMLRKLTGWNNAHFEVRRGTQHQAVQYTKKDETAVKNADGTSRWFEAGTAAPPDAVGVWADIAHMIKNGATAAQVASKHVAQACRSINGIAATIAAIKVPPPRRNVRVFMLYGPTRTGKTHSCFDLHDNLPEGQNKGIYIKFEGGQPLNFDGYTDQAMVIFDEFIADTSPTARYTIPQLNPIMDKYPLLLNVKNSTVHAMFDIVIFCTNIHPSKMYTRADPEVRKAFFARIPPHHMIYCPKQAHHDVANPYVAHMLHCLDYSVGKGTKPPVFEPSPLDEAFRPREE